MLLLAGYCGGAGVVQERLVGAHLLLWSWGARGALARGRLLAGGFVAGHFVCLVLRGSRGLFRRREVDFYPLLGLTFHVRTTRMGEEKVVETLGEECSLLLGDPLARWPVLKSLMRGGL